MMKEVKVEDKHLVESEIGNRDSWISRSNSNRE